MEVSGQANTQPLGLRGKSFQYPLNRRLVGCRASLDVLENANGCLLGYEPHFICPITWSPY